LTTPVILTVSAALACAKTHATPIAVVDNGGNIASNLDALAALGGQLLSLEDTDSQQHWLGWNNYFTAIPFASAISVADLLALAPKTVDFQGNPAQFTDIVDSAANVGAHAAQLLALGGQMPAGAIHVNDSAANVAANATALATLVGKLSLTVSDTAAAINANQAALLSVGGLQALVLPDGNNIGLWYDDGVSAATNAANAISLVNEGLALPLHVVDSCGNIAGQLDALAAMGGQLLSLQDTDSQWHWNGMNGYYTATPFASAISVADLLALAPKTVDFQGKPAQFTDIVDSAANVGAHAAQLLALGGQIIAGAIHVNDSAANVAANATALATLVGKLSLTVSDTAAAINANQAALLSVGGLQALVLPDGTGIGIQSSDGVSVTLSTANAISLVNEGLALPLHVVDTGGNIAGQLDALAAMGGQLLSLEDTDSQWHWNGMNGYYTAIPFASAISVADLLALAPKTVDFQGKPAQFTDIVDSAANVGTHATQLLALGGQVPAESIYVNDTVANVVANASKLATLGSELSLSVSDSAANVQASLDNLQAIAGQISSLSLTDASIPTLVITATQLSGDTGVLGLIVSAYTLTVSGVAVDNLTSVLTNQQVQTVTVSDSASKIQAALNTLQADNSKITGISLTNGGTLTMAASQFLADAPVLGKIATPYNITLTDKTTPTLSIAASQFAVDAAALGKITSPYKLALTDKGTPAIALTASQYSQDSTQLSKISTPYSLKISGETIANLATDLKNSHVSSVGITDSAANVLAVLDTLLPNAAKLSGIALTDAGTPALAITASQLVKDAAVLDTLLPNAAKLSGIALTDAGTPALAITASQLVKDAAVLGKISSPYSLSISGELAASVATDVKNSHVTGIAVVDSAAHVSASLATLATNASKLSGITLTDKTTPTLSLSAAQVTADLGVLNAITSPYLLSVKDTVANINNLNLSGVHDSQIEIMPTSLLATLTENTTVTDLNLSPIKLTGDSITEKVYQGGTEVDIVNSKGAVANQLFFTHDSEAQLHLLGIGATVVHVM